MTENELSKILLDASFKIHTKFGPGILESAYEKALAPGFWPKNGVHLTLTSWWKVSLW
jgi:hypothetical protein